MQVRKGYVVSFGQRFWKEGETLPPSILDKVKRNQAWKLENNDGKKESNTNRKDKEENEQKGKKGQEIADIANNRMLDKNTIRMK